MQFLKTAFWVAVAVIIVIFSVNNWTGVNVYLWNGMVMETKLPVLVIGAFLLGCLPVWAWHRATRWRLKRKLESTERALATAVAPTSFPATTAQDTPENLGTSLGGSNI